MSRLCRKPLDLGLGAAMMTWLEVCKEVVGSGGGKEDTEAQTYYGRLLAVNGVCELVTSQLVGVASDKYGRRSVQIAAQLGQVSRSQAGGSAQGSVFGRFEYYD